MAIIKAPVTDFNGEVAGVAFRDGVGECSVPWALSYFKRQGYEVTEPAPNKAPAKKAPAKKTAAKQTAAPDVED